MEASVKGFDEERDLAVVSVSLDDVEDDTMDAISIANIGSSDDLKVGEQVVAIGNALGYGQYCRKVDDFYNYTELEMERVEIEGQYCYI